ncbi:MAG: HAD-IA family hydrolase [Acidobacteriaceae bacterium]|nr:HAD-IA family hydrolase [Acidobacteriaceae bacterium]
MANRTFRAVFSDIGGVLGTNGWDTGLRRRITDQFHCDFEDIERRHSLMFDSFERGHISFEDYLRRVFFAVPRGFGLEDIRDFAYKESTPWPDNIRFLQHLKRSNELKLALISNEGEGLTEYRVEKFGLRELADFVIFSHFVHMRKPDPEIWQLALNLLQLKPSQTIYIDDRALFADIAAGLGFIAIHHVSLEMTRHAIAGFGLTV